MCCPNVTENLKQSTYAWITDNLIDSSTQYQSAAYDIVR